VCPREQSEFSIRMQSPALQVKYVDGELESLGVIFVILVTYYVLKMVPMIVVASVLLTWCNFFFSSSLKSLFYIACRVT
jgi:hypothetical protein